MAKYAHRATLDEGRANESNPDVHHHVDTSENEGSRDRTEMTIVQAGRPETSDAAGDHSVTAGETIRSLASLYRVARYSGDIPYPC